MSQFIIYLQLGFEHISDVKGYDHILFIVSLCAVYTFKEWKNVAWLVTAFTLGHSITLALASLKIIVFNPSWIEFLIPVTIFSTCLSNLFLKKENRSGYFRYVLVLLFGFIHGMGFSNFFNALMGHGQSIVFPLFSFNLGLEFGQLLIVFILLAINWLLSRYSFLKQNIWVQLISGISGAVSLWLIVERGQLLFQTF